MSRFSVTTETVAAMLTYCNVTPGVVEDMITAMKNLRSAFEGSENGLVQAHQGDYMDLMSECYELMNIITGETDETITVTKKLSDSYAKILSKKIR